jgi:hypothetical protein
MVVTVGFRGGPIKGPLLTQRLVGLVFALSPTIVDLGKLAPLSSPPIILAYL